MRGSCRCWPKVNISHPHVRLCLYRFIFQFSFFSFSILKFFRVGATRATRAVPCGAGNNHPAWPERPNQVWSDKRTGAADWRGRCSPHVNRISGRDSIDISLSRRPNQEKKRKLGRDRIETGWKLTGQHVHVGTVGDAENVGRHFVTSLANVHLDDSVGVDGEAFVRIDGHAEETGVGLL